MSNEFDNISYQPWAYPSGGWIGYSSGHCSCYSSTESISGKNVAAELRVLAVRHGQIAASLHAQADLVSRIGEMNVRHAWDRLNAYKEAVQNLASAEDHRLGLDRGTKGAEQYARGIGYLMLERDAAWLSLSDTDKEVNTVFSFIDLELEIKIGINR